MTFDAKWEISEISQELTNIRRDIHAHPELGFHEFRTAQIVEKYLRASNLEVRRCASTGVIGILRGAYPGKTVMLRAELDALPITEENDLPFCSQNPGVMHACGHDCNIAIQLGAAKILAAHQEELPGTIMFLFQPNEEECGAPQMIEDHALENPRPDAIFAPHVWAHIPIGMVGVVPGPQCASSYYFKVVIRGKDTAGYAPWLGTSPIVCARHVMDAIDTMQALEYNMLDQPTLITVGMIHSGNYMINIPEDLELQGSIRCLHDKEKAVHSRFREIVENVCKTYRCTCEISITCGNHLLSNDAALYDIVCAASEETLGENQVTAEGVREMGGDDLAEFFREGIPGCYYLIGMGNAAKGTTAAHHNKDFLADEDVIALGAELQVRIVLHYLSSTEQKDEAGKY